MSSDHDHDHDHSHDSGALGRVEALLNERVHAAGDHEGPFSLHILGLGATGAEVIASAADSAPEGFTALAVDIASSSFDGLADLPGVSVVDMAIPSKDALSTALNRYREFLKMEYPRYYWNPNYEPWLPGDMEMPEPGGFIPRAVAKAIYGSEYYQDGEITSALDEFAAGILASTKTPLVVVAFSMAETVGSGIVVEIARHLSSIKLGRRPWVIGLGVLPVEPSAQFFPVINELDCMIDTEKNNGVMAVWGDLYKNPFTGGFFAVPDSGTEDPVPGAAAFLTADGCVPLYETMKGLNWLAVPGDQWHPAIRGQQSETWINILATVPAGAPTAPALGLVDTAGAPWAEIRALGGSAEAAETVARAVSAAVDLPAGASVVTDADSTAGIVSVVVAAQSKLALSLFVPSREIYDRVEDWDDKLMMHSWLLDLGVMLCEPSIRFDGMGGECIWGCACWVVVPHKAIRGELIESTITVTADA